MSDIDVESTLREVRALTPASRPPASSRSSLITRARHLIRRTSAAAGYWFAQGQASHAGDMSRAAGQAASERTEHGRRLQVLEQEQVMLRQATIRLSEALAIAEGAHHAALRRIDQLEAQLEARDSRPT